MILRSLFVPNHQCSSFLYCSASLLFVSHYSVSKNQTKKMSKIGKKKYHDVHVRSYPEFRSLVEQYVIQGGAPAVSFDISDYVSSRAYGHMLDEVIANNSKLGRLDKIEHPRNDHLPQPIITCYTVKEMELVYKAIGSNWRAFIALRPYYKSERNDETSEEMDEFTILYGIVDHIREKYG